MINTYLAGRNLLILFDDFEKFQPEVNKEILSELELQKLTGEEVCVY